ncbi:unnamed protein product, partial [Brenthis ino]
MRGRNPHQEGNECQVDSVEPAIAGGLSEPLRPGNLPEESVFLPESLPALQCCRWAAVITLHQEYSKKRISEIGSAALEIFSWLSLDLPPLPEGYYNM